MICHAIIFYAYFLCATLGCIAWYSLHDMVFNAHDMVFNGIAVFLYSTALQYSCIQWHYSILVFNGIAVF